MGAAALSAIGLALAVMGFCFIALVARTIDPPKPRRDLRRHRPF
jgi:hypothetical protein